MNQINKALNRVLDSFEPASTTTGTVLVSGESRRIAVLSMEIGGLDDASADISPDILGRFNELIINELCTCASICGGELRRAGTSAVTAFFGTGREAEQACRRAVDSGFRMLKTLEMINRSIDDEQDTLRFHGKIGIAWGPATVTMDKSCRTRITGDCVELSQDLMRGTLPGVILVSHEAKSSCGDFFSWDSFPGTSEDRFWVPVAEKDRVSVHPLLEGIPLLGRDREMDHLAYAWDSYRKWFNHSPVMVLGKPGIGKTRLIDHFLNTISDPGTKTIRLSNRLWDQPPLGMWLPLMEKGTFDPYGTIMARIRDLRAEYDLVVCIEDLHWADEASMKLLDQLSRSLCDSGVFLLLSSRSEPEGTICGYSEKLNIQGLDFNSIKELLLCILGKPEGSEADRFTEFLMERAAGNPLLVIELILHSMETGTIGRDSRGYWYIDKEPEEIIPHSAESFLQARMNTLNAMERFALQVASVLGNGFRENVFTGILSSLGYESGSILLSRICNMGFLSSGEEQVYNFSNSILSGTVYRTIIKENRMLIHKKAAEFLASAENRSIIGTEAISVARHWIESESGEQAVPWLFKAIAQCIDLGDVIRAETLSRELHRRVNSDPENTDAQKLEFFDARLNLTMGKFQLAYDSVIRIIPGLQGPELAMALFLQGHAMENLGLPLKDAIVCYEKSASVAASSRDVNTLAQALSAAGSLHLATGNKQKALDSFSRALDHRESLDSLSLAKLHGNMGILMHRTGSNEDALRHYEITLELGRKSGNMGIEANALAFMGQVQINMGQKDAGLEKYRKALAIHRSAGNRRGECTTLGNLGGQLARFGEVNGAIEMLERAIGIADDIGHTRGIMTFHSNLGLALRMAGEYEKAEKHIRTAMDMISVSGDKRTMAVAHLNLCTVLAKMKRFQEAINEARRALRFACGVNALTTQARALNNIGWLMMRTDNLEMGRNFFKEAYKRSFLADDHSMLASNKIGEGRVCFELGLMDEARSCYLKAMELKDSYSLDFESLDELDDLKRLLDETGTYGQSC